MIVYHCDVCGTRMTGNDGQRYIVRIEAFAATGPLEITDKDLQKDHAQEIRELIETLSQQTQDQVEDSVYRAFRYDLCAACHAKFLSQGLPGLQGMSEG